jgi:hypothetical protein
MYPKSVTSPTNPIMGINKSVTRRRAWPFCLFCEQKRSDMVNLQGRYIFFNKPESQSGNACAVSESSI